MVFSKKQVLIVMLSLSSFFAISSKKFNLALPASGHVTKEGVNVVVDAISPEQCIHCFGVEGRKTLVPLRFRVTNNSLSEVVLSYEGINLPLMRPADAEKALHHWNFFSTIFRGVGVYFGIGMVISGVAAVVSTVALAPVAIGTSLFSLGVFAIPTFGFSLGADYLEQQSNKEVNTCMECKVLEKDWDLSIAPGQRIQTFVFIKSKKYQPHFVVTLYDKKNNKDIEFPIDLAVNKA